MLRPQNSRTRECIPISGLWDFRFDPEDVGIREQWFADTLTGARKMSGCCSYNEVLTGREARAYVGPVWYQTSVRIPRGWRSEQVYLYFESVTHHASVWIDTVQAAVHQGGYTPFEAALPASARPGEPIRITVRVDNTLSFHTIPPGLVETTPVGKKQRYWHDFINYAGIHRNVWLCSRNADHFDRLRVETTIDGDDGRLRYRCESSLPGAITVNVFDREERPVASGRGAEGTLTVPRAHRWAIGEGYLYRVQFCLDREGVLVDDYTLRVGIRTVEARDGQILLNGSPIYLRGFGMHEDVGVLGKGHNDAHMLHDFSLLEWVGANSIRTSHYPYSEDFMDHADETGLLVIDETPAVGLNLTGNVIFPGGELKTFSPDSIDAETQRQHMNVLRELIDRDQNHPCVIMWSIANEPQTVTEAAEQYFQPLFQLTRELDSTRPVGITTMSDSTWRQCRVSQYADVLMLNRYYGWYLDLDDLELAARHFQEELSGWATMGKPIIISEYGADALPGMRSTSLEPWSEEYQAAMLTQCHEVMDKQPLVVGEHVWNFADFLTAASIARAGGNHKGVFTRDRKPKQAAYYLRERWQSMLPRR